MHVKVGTLFKYAATWPVILTYQDDGPRMEWPLVKLGALLLSHEAQLVCIAVKYLMIVAQIQQPPQSEVKMIYLV